MPDWSPTRLRWEERYGADEYVFGTAPNDFLRASVPDLPRGRAMCLAEGEGRNAVFLAEQGWEVHSIDLTEAGVVKTRRLAEARCVHVDAVTGDLAEADLGVETWDLVVSIFCHLPPEVRADLHRRVVASLRPGGVLLLEAYTPDQIGKGTGGPPAPELAMTLDALRTELAGLEIEQGAELERLVIEGDGHTGTGVVVQVLARKPV